MVHKFVARKLDGSAAHPTRRPPRGAGGGESAWDELRPVARAGSDWRLVREDNRYIDEAKPWVLRKDRRRPTSCTACSADCCETLRWAALMVAPAMPDAAREILRQLGRGARRRHLARRSGAGRAARLTEPKPVFPRIEPERQAALIDTWTGATPGAAPRRHGAGRSPRGQARGGRHPFDDFAKLDLRVAKVTAAERVPKADKLLEADARCRRRPTDGRLRNRARLHPRSRWSERRSSTSPT